MHALSGDLCEWMGPTRSPIAPLTLTGVQATPAPSWTPEQRLLWAILDDAWQCAVGTQVYLGGQRTTALEWFSAGDRSWPFSFHNICQHLSLEPEPVERWARAQLAQLRLAAAFANSHYRGVYRYGQRWAARIGKEQQFLGSFATEEDAARAYNAAAKRRYRHKARLNAIEEERDAA